MSTITPSPTTPKTVGVPAAHVATAVTPPSGGGLADLEKYKADRRDNIAALKTAPERRIGHPCQSRRRRTARRYISHA